jgi:hypothetical protein
VLAASFRDHNPDARFSALVIDDPDGEIGPGEPFEVLHPRDLGLDDEELHRRATMYTAQAFTSSLKPNVLLTLLRRHREPALLLDADGCVYASLDPVADRAQRHSVVVSPQSLDPQPATDDFAPERTLVAGGPMNGGFVAVGAGAERFLEWWIERTRRHCIYLRQAGLAYSEAWLTLVPALFDHHVLRDDRGCNVMGWNLHVRDVEWDGDVPMIDGGRLRHFHFASSFDPERPHLLAAYQAAHRGWWPLPAERPGMARLCRDYAARLLSHGYREDRAMGARYASMPDGTVIELWMRELYRSAVVASESGDQPEPPNPFTHGPKRFLAWVRERESEPATRPAPALPDAALGDVGRVIAELERRDAEDEHLRDEADAWRKQARDWREAFEAERVARIDVEREASETIERADYMQKSMSWRITRPLRSAAAAVRRVRTARARRP